ncbi:hypothetical protein SLOPH_1801 [Spraguea lophii 42_110]|uniref:Uncharacterized protein n=1 Tax=Spraguea lophii (strain 42_110) TaxID=1358809 RepID=S7W7F6_SPRLO|nr:hypothetical protein SLOPH_1801 [Spraguea lophii 42_110]
MNNKETGISIIFFGLIFFFLGLLLLDTGLLCASNVIIVAGLSFLLKTNILNLTSGDEPKGILIFCTGVIFIFMRFFLFGFLFEVTGLFIILKSKIGGIKNKAKTMLFGILSKRIPKFFLK